MKVRNIFWGVFFMMFLPCWVFPQNPYRPKAQYLEPKQVLLDTAYMKVSYKMCFWDANHETTSDERVVEIGKSYRYEYSSVFAVHEEECMKLVSEGAATIPSSSSRDVYPMEFYRNPDGSWVTVIRTITEQPILRYEESPVEFSWQLLSETEDVLGYPCQRARTEYKGRAYDAWYTPLLPVGGGPYKVCGLPGLILKVADTAGDYSWEATGIERGAWPVYEQKFLMQECTREQARKLVADMFSNPFYFMVKIGGIQVAVPDKSSPQGFRELDEREFSIKNYYYYDPIERE